MKVSIFLLLLVAALAGAAGFGIAHRFLCRPALSDLERLQDVSHLARALDLRPDQVETLNALQSHLCGQLAACCDRHCVCRRELAAALVAEPFDAARTQELRESLGRSYAESERLAQEHMRTLREILDESQRARFDRMIMNAMK